MTVAQKRAIKELVMQSEAPHIMYLTIGNGQEASAIMGFIDEYDDPQNWENEDLARYFDWDEMDQVPNRWDMLFGRNQDELIKLELLELEQHMMKMRMVHNQKNYYSDLRDSETSNELVFSLGQHTNSIDELYAGLRDKKTLDKLFNLRSMYLNPTDYFSILVHSNTKDEFVTNLNMHKSCLEEVHTAFHRHPDLLKHLNVNNVAGDFAEVAEI
jgi:hypothetical protein